MTDTDGQTTEVKPHRPFIPHFIRILAIPIILAWVALTVIVNVAVPTLEIVGESRGHFERGDCLDRSSERLLGLPIIPSERRWPLPPTSTSTCSP